MRISKFHAWVLIGTGLICGSAARADDFCVRQALRVKPTYDKATCACIRDALQPSERRKWNAFERLDLADYNLSCIQRGKADQLESLAVTQRDIATRLDATAFALREAALNARAQADTNEGGAARMQAEAETNFMGMTFGVGMGFSQAGNRVEEAEIAADGTVRVLKRQKQTPRVILEAHYYGFCRDMKLCKERNVGIGPFFGIATSSDSTIDAFALGIMFGVKDTSKDSPGGFSVGIGAVLDREVKTLARGFVEGAKPPTGETVVVFEKRSKWSPLLMFTRTF